MINCEAFAEPLHRTCRHREGNELRSASSDMSLENLALLASEKSHSLRLNGQKSTRK